MIKKLYYLTFAFVILTISAFAQGGSGELKGTVTDKATKQPIPFASVVVYSSGNQVAGTQTDFDGNYKIKPISPGKYDVKAAILGYSPIQLTGVVVYSDKISFANIAMGATVETLTAVEKVDYKVPVFEKDNTSNSSTLTREQINNAPTRNILSMASMAGGVYQANEGGELNVMGSRGDATTVYVDGMKVLNTNSIGLPKSGIEQVTITTGGVPAMYGDLTGGVINITSRGPSRGYNLGTSYETSEFLDPYGHNLGDISISGPLYNEKDKSKQPKAGFFLTGQFQTDKDPNPSPQGSYKLKDAKLQDLKSNPSDLIVTTSQGTPIGNYQRRAEYLSPDDVEKLPYKQNNRQTSYNLNGKIEFIPFKNTVFSVGGNFSYVKAKNYNGNSSLLNYENFTNTDRAEYRVWTRFTQKFSTQESGDNKNSASLIKNAYYNIQVDFTKTLIKTYDDRYKDDLFKYGHVGKFTTQRTKSYEKIGDSIRQTSNNNIIAYNFDQAADYAKDKAVYTDQAYQLASMAGQTIVDPFQVSGYGGFANGLQSSGFLISSMYLIPGFTGGYSKVNNDQFRFSAQASADVKDHAIQFGIEFEQRNQRTYTIGATNLWTTMRLLTNTHLSGIDSTTRTVSVYNNGDVLDGVITNGGTPVAGDNIIRYETKYNQAQQTYFDKQLRESLGMAENGKNYIDIDSYDPSTFNLGLFKAEDLILNNGLRYYGFDYQGNVVSGNPKFDDFFKDSINKPHPSYRPNYIAAFVQDKFAFRDLIFNVGVRVDRYDANQKMLKDIYSFYPNRTADDPTFASTFKTTRPTNIGGDYAVYVDDVSNPQKVIGYRQGDTWYDASGSVVDYTYLYQGKPQMRPWLVNAKDVPNKNIKDAFVDYIPQINIMPRIAFSFPISDEALFYAHYDVLTKRPSEFVNRLDLYQYIYPGGATLSNGISNAGLLPEKTIDYSLGFKQKISNNSAIAIEATYREQRDMTSLKLIKGSFPDVSYQTYTNSDFGTYKGLTLTYDLRRIYNIQFKTSYTLGFADGTGSDANSSLAFSNVNLPYVRAIFPLSYDQRHTIVASIDYRYGIKEDYNGPIVGDKRILEDAGINFIVRAGSGTPYTLSSSPAPSVYVGRAGNVSDISIGSINGARLPANFRIDMKIDKNFNFNFGAKGDDKKPAILNVYFQIQNLLNTENILAVYRFTGSPNNDGYLNSTFGQQDVKTAVNPATFALMYNTKLNNTSSGNYGLARRIWFGVALSF